MKYLADKGQYRRLKRENQFLPATLETLTKVLYEFFPTARPFGLSTAYQNTLYNIYRSSSSMQKRHMCIALEQRKQNIFVVSNKMQNQTALKHSIVSQQATSLEVVESLEFFFVFKRGLFHLAPKMNR